MLKITCKIEQFITKWRLSRKTRVCLKISGGKEEMMLESRQSMGELDLPCKKIREDGREGGRAAGRGSGKKRITTTQITKLKIDSSTRNTNRSWLCTASIVHWKLGKGRGHSDNFAHSPGTFEAHMRRDCSTEQIWNRQNN